ncbi:Ca2+-dependent phosphoinositide-specific phospholipase C [Sphingomonas sp. BIUV-7]|uniref:Ca2+-dependent phosphoinositide-specific phospholipase C n=1 Tax=Sphingomonas natans TaxID=3063330 RepID=A0ABT8YD67_9SPHN|nr:Ca2+-dependent phosphoinositide-specific phospholipase C [Sphingomonas sp. BIUV-7]MDO6416288.1 Ca2+-dependent phosphoinositide-specific phospholipase C [Sphingomonas sp. BIUV-7]
MPRSPAFLVALAAILSTPAFAAPKPEASSLDPELKLNQIQVLGTHNSYAMPVDKRLLAIVDPILGRITSDLPARLPPDERAKFREEHPNDVSASDGLGYLHPDLTTQLNEGMRSLEIDVNPDPLGGNFADPAGYRLLRAKGVTDLLPYDASAMNAPGYKVLHIPDVDFRSHCPTLKGCLTEIRDWSDAHPDHVPVFLVLEAKVADLALLPEPTHTVPFTPALFDDLDHEIVSILGRQRLITPDDVRGTHRTLNEAIRAGGWPSLRAARGKIIILMITATGEAATRGYLAGHPSLEGRAAFLRAKPGEDHAAFLMFDNALVRQREIRDYVRQGYIVRTRSDIEAFEAKTNDMRRATAAFASGAQIVSTDFEHAGNAFGTPYVVRLRGGGVARRNPSFPEPARAAERASFR